MHYLLHVHCSYGAEEMFVILSALERDMELYTECDLVVSLGHIYKGFT